MVVYQRSHPALLFTYFLLNVIILIIQRQPLIILFQFVCLLVLTHDFHKYDLLLLAIITISNPLFVHRGQTVIYRFITLEALIYGFIFGILIINVLMMFRLMNKVLNSEHYIYLFSHYFPTISLMISMIFSLIPRFIQQFKDINTAQKQFYDHQPIRRLLNTFSIETTWAFETSLVMLDSMSARGYGTGKRSYFDLFVFRNKDFIRIIEVIGLFIIGFIGYYNRFNNFYYYPMIIINPFKLIDYFYLFIYGFIIVLPLLWEVSE